jgi:hypothetical protein
VLGSDSGRDTLPDRQYATTATTDLHHTPVRLTATTGLTGLSVERSWAPGRGMADITAGAAGVGAITVAEAMVLDIPVAEAGVTVAAPQPTVGAVLRAVQGAATVAAPVVDFTAEQVVSTVVVGMAADAAN